MDIVRTPADHKQIEQERYEMFALPAYTDQKWGSRRKFLARPWSRVMQEHALASRVNMMHGTLILEGETLPGLTSQMIARGFTPRFVVGADSYPTAHCESQSCRHVCNAVRKTRY